MTAKLCCPPNAHETKRPGVAWSQKWLPYHLPEGYSGVTGVRSQRQNESNRTPGNSPRRWRRARAYIDITHTVELEHKLSLSIALHFLFETNFTRSWANIHLWPNITNFFLFVQRSIVRIFLLFFTNSNYLHQNLTHADEWQLTWRLSHDDFNFTLQ